VAKLAGLPADVLKRAQEVLHALEQGDSGRRAKTLVDDLPLFAAALAPATQPHFTRMDAKLNTLNVDELSPREALQLVYELKALANDRRKDISG
jgi:DNA mismatch repair protein MutS